MMSYKVKLLYNLFNQSFHINSYLAQVTYNQVQPLWINYLASSHIEVS